MIQEFRDEALDEFFKYEDPKRFVNQTCNCKKPYYVRFKEPREYKGQLIWGCQVPCGKCELCMKRRQREWFIRNYFEFKNSETAYFITLTYDEEHLPNGVVKKDCQDFLKRLRKPLGKHRISYFLVSEYGDQFHRPHYHMLLYNYPLKNIENVKKSIEEAWQNGLASVGSVTSASINYCTKYCLKAENKNEGASLLPPVFMLCSRRPALGSSFVQDERNKKYYAVSKSTYRTIDGCKYPLPGYYKHKLFDDSTLEALYLEGLERVECELSDLFTSVGSARDARKLQREKIEADCESIRRKQELASMRGNSKERKFKLNQKPESKKL